LTRQAGNNGKYLTALLSDLERLLQVKEARIVDSLKRVTDVLHHRSVDRIPVLQMSQTILYPRHEIFASREKNLTMQLANITRTLAHDTDYVPYLDPFEGVTVLSEAFGCSVEVPRDGDPWIRESLISDKPEYVYDLKKPRSDNQVYRRVIETLRYFEDTTGRLLPVGATDPQGPLDVASLIWNNQDFIQACVLHKNEVHHLLDLVTEAFIEFFSRQYEVLSHPAFPVHSFPLVDTDDGISISDDEAILLSPELYEEFGLPYLNRISDAFGGLYYHCCGDFGFLLDKILQIKNLRAINGHLSPNELKPASIDRVLQRDIGLFIGISDREIGWNDDRWRPGEEIELYEHYYLPEVIGASEGRGVVLVGYGGYFGYMDLPEPHDAGGMLVGVGGHAIQRGPLVNVSIEEKNRNFKGIQSRIRELLSA
jgi:uroporphyrinogen-III decarboxylase